MIGLCQLLTLTIFLSLTSQSTLVTPPALINGGASITTSLPSLNKTSVNLPIVPIDRRFTVEGIFSDVPIDELSCLMVGVDTMADLALRNWIDSTRAFRSHVLPKYPLVYLEARPEPPATEIPIRFLIWALDMALQQYIIRSSFNESEFHLLYNSRIVGKIIFRSTFNIPGQSAQQNNSSVNASSTPPALNAPNRSDSNTFIKFLPNAQALDRGSVFLSIYATLRAVAFPRSSSISATPFRIRPGWGRNIEVGFTSSDGPQQLPELQYRWIIEALREVPDWMVEIAFKDVMIYVYVEDNLVGRGFVDTPLAQVLTPEHNPSY